MFLKSLTVMVLVLATVESAWSQPILRRKRRRTNVTAGLKFKMPGKSFSGKLLPLTKSEKKIAAALKRDVTKLAGEIGPRSVYVYQNLVKAEKFLTDSLTQVGYKVKKQTYQARGRDCSNLIVEVPGNEKKEEIVVVGGHYDSVFRCPGANDNGSGTAGTLALARLFFKRKSKRTIRFVFFVNEEPPWFQTEQMGSLVYARQCKKRGDKIVAMYSLETIGYYSDEKGSQKYPAPLSLFYPSTGNFIAFVGDISSAKLVTRTTKLFRDHAKFPSQGAAMPAQLPGVGWSDQWSFWQVGYPGVMITDTATFRYPHYHQNSDTPDKLDYKRMARVIKGLEKVIGVVAN